MAIIIETPAEIFGVDKKGKKWRHGHCLGAKLIHFEILNGLVGSKKRGLLRRRRNLYGV